MSFVVSRSIIQWPIFNNIVFTATSLRSERWKVYRIIGEMSIAVTHDIPVTSLTLTFNVGNN